MRRIATLVVAALVLLPPAALRAQLPDARQVAQERARAELEVPQLAALLELRPGMTVADVGAGFGATTVVMAKSIGNGKVFATDVGQRQLQAIRDYIERETLTNVTVLEGAAAATNLPAACCDAIFMRDVYHHVTDVDAFNTSVLASLKPGGRFAVLDFVPRAGSALPEGVRANRGGHGISTAIVVEELTAAGFTHLQTFDKWPPDDKSAGLFLVLFRK
ncbi:MAG TPA: methyltransferase domain-containing protein [Vicinamibacterales bacterium]|jgi:predicted methyltransferase